MWLCAPLKCWPSIGPGTPPPPPRSTSAHAHVTRTFSGASCPHGCHTHVECLVCFLEDFLTHLSFSAWPSASLDSSPALVKHVHIMMALPPYFPIRMVFMVQFLLQRALLWFSTYFWMNCSAANHSQAEELQLFWLCDLSAHVSLKLVAPQRTTLRWW